MKRRLLICAGLAVATAAQAQGAACTIYPRGGMSYQLPTVEDCLENRLMERDEQTVMHVPYTNEQYRKAWDDRHRRKLERSCNDELRNFKDRKKYGGDGNMPSYCRNLPYFPEVWRLKEQQELEAQAKKKPAAKKPAEKKQ